jgi:hypothetical protein
LWTRKFSIPLLLEKKEKKVYNDKIKNSTFGGVLGGWGEETRGFTPPPLHPALLERQQSTYLVTFDTNYIICLKFEKNTNFFSPKNRNL